MENRWGRSDGRLRPQYANLPRFSLIFIYFIKVAIIITAWVYYFFYSDFLYGRGGGDFPNCLRRNSPALSRDNICRSMLHPTSTTNHLQYTTWINVCGYFPYKINIGINGYFYQFSLIYIYLSIVRFDLFFQKWAWVYFVVYLIYYAEIWGKPLPTRADVGFTIANQNEKNIT